MNTPLNPGIVATVQWLNAHGFKTCDSGDGQTHDHACDLDIPYVHILVERSLLITEADRLRDLLKARGVQVEAMDPEGKAPHIDAHYNPVEDFATLSLFNVRL